MSPNTREWLKWGAAVSFGCAAFGFMIWSLVAVDIRRESVAAFNHCLLVNAARPMADAQMLCQPLEPR